MNFVLLLASGLIVGVLINYFSNFPFVVSKDQAVWGQFGDYFGGVLNPLLSFFALLGLLATLKAQQKEAKKAEDRHQQQTFDARLFQLLSLSHEAVAAVKYIHSGVLHQQREEYEGHRGVAHALNRLQEEYLYLAGRDPEHIYDSLKEQFCKWKTPYWSGVASYIESMLFILKYVIEKTSASQQDHDFALRAVFAQMSSDEKLLVFYVMLFTREQSILLSGSLINEFLAGATVDDLQPYRRQLLHAAVMHRLTPQP
ncbi:hypothetical protein [Pseudomonas shirazensis]